MHTITRSVSSKDLRDNLADILGGVACGSERIGVAWHGKLTTVAISVDDLELLEELEAARDAAEFSRAKAADDGQRMLLDALRAEAP